MEKRTVINPITRAKIGVGSKIYKNFIDQGFVEKNGTLVKKLKIYDDDLEKEVNNYEKQQLSSSTSSIDDELSDDDFFDSDSDKDEKEIDYGYNSDEDDNNINNDYDDDDKPAKIKREDDYSEEEYNVGEQQVVYESKRPFFTERELTNYTENLPFVRCECGKPIGFLAKRYELLEEQGYDREEIYKKLGLSRSCCMKNLTHQPQQLAVFPDKNKMYDLPSAKSVRVKKDTDKKEKNKKDIDKKKKGKKNESSSEELDDNPYLTGKITKDLKKMDLNKRVYEHAYPVKTNYNPKLLPRRNLSKTMYVSYVGK